MYLLYCMFHFTPLATLTRNNMVQPRQSLLLVTANKQEHCTVCWLSNTTSSIVQKHKPLSIPACLQCYVKVSIIKCVPFSPALLYPHGWALGNQGSWPTLTMAYWTTLFRDLLNYCKSWRECQKTYPGRKQHAPLIPLPIVEEPFHCITMHIVVPCTAVVEITATLTATLVVCDYTTWYSEAMPPCSMAAN